MINFIILVNGLVYPVVLVYILPMPDGPKTERVTTMMASSEVKAVDDWRRQHPDLPSRSEAIRRLIELGLDAAKQREPAQ